MSIADLWYSSQVRTYLFGLNTDKSGPFKFLNIRLAMLDVFCEVRNLVTIRFIALKPRSHSDVLHGSVSIVLSSGFRSSLGCVPCVAASGFSFNSLIPLMACSSSNLKRLHKRQTSNSPYLM